MEEKPRKRRRMRGGIQRAKRDYNKNNDPRKPFWNERGYWDKHGKYYSGIPKELRKRKKCGAKTRSGGTCGRWGMKNGRCSRHGGKNVTKYYKKGADPVGDKETIWFDLITEEEEQFLETLKLDAETSLNEELKLITIRERRMMQRINALTEQAFIVVSKTKEHEKGDILQGSIDKVKTTEYAESTLTQIQKIEEALTKVQEKKAKLIDLKLKVQEVEEGDQGALETLVKVLRSSKKRIAKTKKRSDQLLGND